MTNDDNGQSEQDALFERRKQTSALKDMLTYLELARRQISLYGADHPNSNEVINELAESVRVFLMDFERATCIFTKDAVIVNDHYFSASTDSVDIFRRIRARGVMAVTFVGTPPLNQLQEFAAFLNVEPQEVRTKGGPSNYLRVREVSRIVVTESVYTAGDEADGEDRKQRLDCSSKYEDHAIASAIDWLARQDDYDGPDLPRLPIIQILSNPESAAKLIREAVTKLHASGRDNTSGEVACEVVHDLKSFASANPDEWDEATPQIRKAISKLPTDMRPSLGGFTFDDEVQAGNRNGPKADIQEIETMIGELIRDASGSELPEPSAFEELFESHAYGPLANWRAELQPKSVMNSTAATLVTLLRWEHSTCEHARIAQALAELALRALEINNLDTAVLIAGSLIENADVEINPGWRRSNARSALQGLPSGALATLVNRALASDSNEAKRISASLIELCPDIALEMIELLGTHAYEEFRQSLLRAVVRAGTSAASGLSDLLRDGTPSGKVAALEALVGIGRGWALEEIAEVIWGEDTALAVKALQLLPNVRVPMTSEILMDATTHQAVEVRCAAIEALGDFGDISALEHLDKLANHRTLFGRSRFTSIQETARRAAARIRREHTRAA